MKDIKHILILPLLLLFTMAVTNVYAQQEDAEALFAMGNRYANGEGVEQDMKKAIEWVEKAAEQGHTKAQSALEQIYEEGEGVEKNPEKAAYWKKRAASPK